MAIRLIGIHRTWGSNALPPNLRERFAAALGLADGRPAQTLLAGNAVLAATGQQRGWRPVTGPDGAHVLFAGHIANRGAISAELGVAASSDAALYAAGLAAWGDAMDLKAIGQFASIVIRPDEDAVRLARSPIDAPPLSYWHGPGGMMASSLINALFATGEVEQRIDRQKIADTLFLNYCESSRSCFEGIARLAAGHRAIVGRDGAQVTRYYDVSALPPVRFADERDYVAEASRLLEEGVRAALDGFSRPAISLSGGFDSQAVAAYTLASRPDQPLRTFTSVPEGGWDGITYASRFGDERDHVKALAAMHPAIVPQWIDAEGDFLDARIEAMFTLTGMPPGNAANMHWVHQLYAKARSQGCDVVLVGEFGNASFSFDGDGALAGLARSGRWLRLWREAGHLGTALGISRWRALVSHGLLPFAPDWLYSLLARLGVIRINDPFATWCPLRREHARTMAVDERARAMGNDPLFRNPRSTRGWRTESAMQGSVDRAEMRQAYALLHGIEIRDPTAYRPLVEFCLSLPDDQFLRDGISRRLARRMLAGRVPDMVLNETRMGQQTADWHLRLGRQRAQLAAELERLSDDPDMAGVLDLPALRRALDDWPDVPLGPAVPRLKLALTRALTTARFIRHVEGRNA